MFLAYDFKSILLMLYLVKSYIVNVNYSYDKRIKWLFDP